VLHRRAKPSSHSGAFRATSCTSARHASKGRRAAASRNRSEHNGRLRKPYRSPKCGDARRRGCDRATAQARQQQRRHGEKKYSCTLVNYDKSIHPGRVARHGRRYQEPEPRQSLRLVYVVRAAQNGLPLNANRELVVCPRISQPASYIVQRVHAQGAPPKAGVEGLSDMLL
jgi:hypothetical protein